MRPYRYCFIQCACFGPISNVDLRAKLQQAMTRHTVVLIAHAGIPGQSAYRRLRHIDAFADIGAENSALALAVVL